MTAVVFNIDLATYNAADKPIVSDDPVVLFDLGSVISGMSTGQLGALSGDNVSAINATDDVLQLSVAQLNALGGVTISSTDVVTLLDTAANIQALTGAQLAAFATLGVDIIDSTDDVLSLTVAQYLALGTVVVTAGDVVTLADTGANIAALNDAQLAALAEAGFDTIDATDNAVTFSPGQLASLNGVTLTAADTVTVVNSYTGFEGTGAATYTAWGAQGVDIIDTGGIAFIWLNASQMGAVLDTSMTFANFSFAYLKDSGANIGALSVAQFARMSGAGVDLVDPTNGVLTLSIAQLSALGSVPLSGGADVITLADTATNLQALTAANFTAYATKGIDLLDSSDNTLSLDKVQTAAILATSMSIVAGDAATLSDTGANIAALSATQFGQLSGHGFDTIDATDDVLSLTAAQAGALSGSTVIAAGDVVTLSDTGTNIANLLAAQFAQLDDHGIDTINASDNALALTAAQYLALGSVTLTAGDVVTLVDTGANLSALTVGQITALAGANVDAINASNDVLSLSLAQWSALGSVTLDGSDVVTLADTGAHIGALSVSEITDLQATFSAIDATDNVLTLSIAQIDALGAVTLTAADVVTLADSAANIQALNAVTLVSYEDLGVDVLDSTDNTLSLNASLTGVILSTSLTFAAGDVVTLSDAGANIAGLSAAEIGQLEGRGFDIINATDDVVTLTVAQYNNLNGVALTAGDFVVLADSGANIAALSAAAIGALADAGVDAIDALDDVLSLSKAQIDALGAVTLAAGDLITLNATASEIEGLGASGVVSYADLGVDILNSTDGYLTPSAAIVVAAIDEGVSFAASNSVNLFDSASNLAALTASQIGELAGLGVDKISLNGAAMSLTVAQYLALGTVVLEASQTFTLYDTGANLAALTAPDIADLAGAHIDAIDASDDELSLAIDQIDALGGVTLTAGDVVTLRDTGAHIGALSAATLAEYGSLGVDYIDSSDDVLSLTVAQFLSLGSTLATGDVVTLADTGAHIAALSDVQLAGLADAGIDAIDATDDAITFSPGQLGSLNGVTLSADDIVTVTTSYGSFEGTGAATYTAWGAQGVDVIDTGGVAFIWLNAAQMGAVLDSSMTFAPFTFGWLKDTGANIAGLSTAQFGRMVGAGVDLVDATDNVLTLSVAKLDALGATPLSSNDVITLADTTATLQALTAANFTAYATQGVDRLDSTDNTLSFSKAQTVAILATSMVIVAGDAATLSDTGANIAALTATQFGQLSGHGFDTIDATDDVLALTAAQAGALSGTTVISAGDAVTIVDTGANIAGLSAAQFALLDDHGIDSLNASNDALSLTVAQYLALGSVTFDAGDVITLADTRDNLFALTVAQIEGLEAGGITAINSSTDNLRLSVAQFNALGNVALTAGDSVFLFDTGANLAALSLVEMAALAGAGVDYLNATDDVISLSIAQLDALGTVTPFLGDVVTLVDTAAHIEALTAADLLAYANNGVGKINATDDTLTFNASQAAALVVYDITADAGDLVSLIDTATAIEALSAAEIGQLDERGFDRIQATGGVLHLSVAQYRALDLSFTGYNDVSIQDTGANLASLTAAEMAAFPNEVNSIDATDDVLALSAAQYLALGTNYVTAEDVVTLTDTGANVAALTVVEIGSLDNRGFDIIDATDDVLTLSLAQFGELGAVTLTDGDVVTLGDTGAHFAALTPSQINLFAAGIDAVDFTDDQASLSKDQIDALSAYAHTTGDTVTMVDTSSVLQSLSGDDFTDYAGWGVKAIQSTEAVLTLNLVQVDSLMGNGMTVSAVTAVIFADTGANIAALNAGQLGQLADDGYTGINATDDVLTLSVAQISSLSVPIAGPDLVTMEGTAAEIEALTVAQLVSFGTLGLDVINSTDDALSLSAAQTNALMAKGITLDTGDVVTLSDSSANIAALSTARFSSLAAYGFDAIDATDDVQTLSAARYIALGSVTLAAGDLVTLADTGSKLAALTPVSLSLAETLGFDVIDATNDALSLTVAQYNALGAVALTGADVVTLADTGANLAALSSSQFAALSAGGIDKIDATNNTLALTKAQLDALGAVTLTAGDVVTLSDTGANIASMSIATLAGLGVDRIDATDDDIAFTLAQVTALGSVALTASDFVAATATSAQISALSAATFSALGTKGVDYLYGEDATVTLNVGHATAMLATGLSVGSAAVVILADTGANIAALSTAQLGQLGAYGFNFISVTDTALALTVAKYAALSSVTLDGSALVTLLDSGTALAGMSDSDFGDLVARGVDYLDATNNSLSLRVAQFSALGDDVALTASDVVVLADTGAALGALANPELAGLGLKGIDRIDATDNMLTLSLMQAMTLFMAPNSPALTASDVVTLSDFGPDFAGAPSFLLTAFAAKGVDVLDATNDEIWFDAAQTAAIVATTMTIDASDYAYVFDTGAGISALTVSQLGKLDGHGIDLIDASDDVLSLTAAQFLALGSVDLHGSDVATVADSASKLGALAPGQIGALAGAGVDIIDATDNVFNLTVAQYRSLGSIALTAGDLVTLSDTGANIAMLDFAELSSLAGQGVDRINATDNVLSLSAYELGLLGSVGLTANDVVTLSDTTAHIAVLSPGQITSFATMGVDVIHSYDEGVMAFSVAQAAAILASPIALAASDSVTLYDTGANLASLTSTQFAQLAGDRFDFIDASDNVLTLSTAQYLALNGVQISPDDVVTLSDTGAKLAALSAAQIGALHSSGVNLINSTTDALSLTVAQYLALGGVTLTGADAVVIADTGANLASLTAGQMGALAGAGIDRIDATNNALTLSLAQLGALGATTLTASDVVTVAENAATLQALSGANYLTLATQGVDLIHSVSGLVDIAASQASAIVQSTISFTPTDLVILSDSGADIAALTPTLIAGLGAHGIDTINATSPASLTIAQALALGGVTFMPSSSTVVSGTGAALGGLTTAQMAAFVSAHIDRIDATDDVLTLSVAKYNALGALALTAGDAVTLADTAAALATLSSANIGDLAAAGIDRIDATNNVLLLTVDQYMSLGAVTLTAGDVVTLSDTGANLAALNPIQIAALAAAGIDRIDATDNVLTLSPQQIAALGSVALTASDVATLSDTEANLEAMSPSALASYAALGVDVIDSTDDVLFLSLAQASAVSATTMVFAAGDHVIVQDSRAAFEALSTAQFAALLSHGVDRLYPVENAMSVTVAKAQLLSPTTFKANDVITLADSGGKLAAMSVGQLSALYGRAVDVIDSTTNTLTLSLAQYDAVGSVGLTASDVIVVTATGGELDGLSAPAVAAMVAKGVDRIDATDDILHLTPGRYGALGAMQLTGADLVTYVDASLGSLSAAALTAIGAKGVDILDGDGSPVSFSKAQAAAIAGSTMLISSGSVATVFDTGANIAALSVAEMGTLAARGFDFIDASDNALSLTRKQYAALAGVALTGSDVVTLTDTGKELGKMTAGEIGALSAAGVDKLDASNDALSLTAAQYLALGSLALAGADVVTLYDTAANLSSLSAAQMGTLLASGVDKINATGNTLDLTLAQYQALAGVQLDPTDYLTISGTAGADTIVGTARSDMLIGNGGDDTLTGGAGNDTLVGGAGADMLNGGLNSDTFVYTSVTDSVLGAADVVDFVLGDKFDLSAVDANDGLGGDQTFARLAGDGAFTAAGQLRLVYDGANTRLELNTDGDSDAEMVIILTGNHTGATEHNGWLL